MKKKVIVLCVNNSCRSQMAEGLLRHFCGDRFEVESAGSEPTRVNENAVRVLKEIGIDISSHRSKSMDEFDMGSFDYVITTCDEAKDACPVVPAKTEIVHFNIKDPAGAAGTEEEVLEVFRSARDEIKAYVLDFCSSR